MLIADRAPPAIVQPAIAPETPVAGDYATSLAALQAQLAAGDCTGVADPLQALAAAGHADNQLIFLIGMASLCRKDYRRAITSFRTILARDPNVVRVRLELGRAYFEKGELVNAQRQFQFARAGNNPPAVARNIDRYLYAIRQHGPLNASIGFAIAPDSNVSSGPSIDTIAIFGLPYKLSADAKSHSGVGLAIDAAVNWAVPLAEHVRWDLAVTGYARRYGRTAYNDTDAALASGPQLVYPGVDVSLHGRVSRRWFGGLVYAKSYGASLDGVVKLTGRSALVLGLSRDWLEYPVFTAQDGPVTSASIGFTRVLTPSSLGRITLSNSRTDTRDPAFTAHAPAVELFGLKEFAGGFSTSIDWRLARARYGYFAAFATHRRDVQNTVQLTVLHRRVSFKGFAPRVTAEVIANQSNIPAWSFKRKRIEIGFTKIF